MSKENIITKFCAKCSQTLAVETFAKNAGRRDGLQGYCRTCMKAVKLRIRPRILERMKQYYKERPAQRAAYSRRYYKTHKEELRIYSAGYRQQNAEYLKRSKREYHLRTWEQRRQQYDARKVIVARNTAKKYGAKGDCSEAQWRAKLEYWGRCCYLCGCHLNPDKTEMEHRIPLSRGGPNWPANLAPACRPCNKSKGKMTEAEYRTKQYFSKYSQADLLLLG